MNCAELMPGNVHRRIPAEVSAPSGMLGVYLRSLWYSAKLYDLLAGVERYCMFVGYPRSGHTLIGSLLNAHPEMVIAHELDALAHVQAGFSRGQIFALLLDRDCAYNEAGRSSQGYTYDVPGQWQGRFEKLRVIGDKKGGRSSMRLRANPDLLGQVRRVIGLPMRIIHEVRNPFDNIATLFARKHRPTLGDCADLYFELLATNHAVGRTMPADEFITIKHEDFVAHPADSLRMLCTFLGVDAPDDYVNACAAVVFESPRKTRANVEWSPGLIHEINRQIARYPFLQGYSFED